MFNILYGLIFYSLLLTTPLGSLPTSGLAFLHPAPTAAPPRQWKIHHGRHRQIFQHYSLSQRVFLSNSLLPERLDRGCGREVTEEVVMDRKQQESTAKYSTKYSAKRNEMIKQSSKVVSITLSLYIPPSFETILSFLDQEFTYSNRFLTTNTVTLLRQFLLWFNQVLIVPH